MTVIKLSKRSACKIVIIDMVVVYVMPISNALLLTSIMNVQLNEKPIFLLVDGRLDNQVYYATRVVNGTLFER